MSTEKQLTGYPSIDKPWMKYYENEKIDYHLPSMSTYQYMYQRTNKADSLPAISYYGRIITYADMYKEIETAAKILQGMGVMAGHRVLFLMPNIPETVYLFYACARIGAVADYIDPRPDSIDPQISALKVLNIIDEEKINAIVSLDLCFLPMIQPIEKELQKRDKSRVLLVKAVDSMNGKAVWNYLKENLQFHGLKETAAKLRRSKSISQTVANAISNTSLEIILYADARKKFRDREVTDFKYEPGTIAAIVHTSGTSSPKPKPIPLTHDNLNCYVHQQLFTNLPNTKSTLHILPSFAAFGLAVILHGVLCIQGTLIEVPEFITGDLGKLIRKYKPSQIVGSPSWFLALIHDPALEKTDLSHLTCVTYGGDSMAETDEIAVNEFLRAHGCKTVLTKGHGMSETCGCASMAMNDHNPYNSMGIPLPLTTYAIVDPDTKEQLRFATDQEYLEGELIISSPCVTPGILDGKEIVQRADYNGETYIFTKDIARMDRNGLITFLSRKDRSFVRFDGYKVKCYEIEKVILQEPRVKYCIISAHYDGKRYGNEIMADILVVPAIKDRNEQINFVEELLKKNFILNKMVSSRQMPSIFRFRTDMPYTKNGKMDYREIAEEPLTGTEIRVDIEESNVLLGELNVR